MKLKIIFSYLLLLCVTISLAQTDTKSELNAFFMQHDSLFTVAAKKNDAETMKKLLKEIFKKYEKLPTEYKKAFSSFNSYKRDYLYNLSCIYSLKNDQKNALTYLKKAIKEGFIDYEHLKNDSDLDNIRNLKTFKSLTEPLKTHYLSILKKGNKYNFKDQGEIPKFSYQSQENENLVNLRKEYNLDSIAGNGNEVSKILNLMYWVHKLIRHDGSSENPEVKNAFNIISVCKNENRGVNCRMMATVLNECYLAIGIKSRQITCMPNEENFDDCHVINMVWSEDLKKWLWIDATFAAYVMNENNEMLSIAEVREKLILNETLILNSDSNWNYTIAQTKEHYLETYMAKNLYRLQCPVESEFNFETHQSEKKVSYIELLPLNYKGQKQNRTQIRNNQNDMTNYVTNNPNLFWAEPKK
jgi:hypothetical protein